MEFFLVELFFLIACFAGTSGWDDSSCEVFSSSRGTFSRVSTTSKYVFFTPNDEDKNNIGTWNEAKEACKLQYLDMAVLTSRNDADSLREFFKRNQFCQNGADNLERTFWLGITDFAKEGNWIDTNLDKRIEFQNFYQFEPINAPKLSALLVNPFKPKPSPQDYGNYAYLKCVDQKEIAMFESHVEGNAGILCQYPRINTCYERSSETIDNEKIHDKLDLLGRTGKRSYYISKKQRSWGSANGYCKAYGAKLLDLDVKSGVDNDELYALYNFFLKWKEVLGLPLWAHSVWTSGRFKNFKEDAEFIWNSTGNSFSTVAEKSINWKFVEDRYYTVHKTYDTFRNAEFSCISVAPLDTEAFGVNTVADESLGFVRSVCSLPHWFVCYGNRNFELPDKPIGPVPDPDDDDDDGGGGGGGGEDSNEDDNDNYVPGDAKTDEVWQWEVIAV